MWLDNFKIYYIIWRIYLYFPLIFIRYSRILWKCVD